MSAAQIGDVEPVIRRVVGARIADRAVVDDLVQDALERLLRAQDRLTPGMVTAYAVVTARNLAADHHRQAARHAAAQPRIADVSVPQQPDEVVLRSEERAAMAVAVARLPIDERDALLAHDIDGVPVGELTADGVTVTTMRARLARSRTKLRVEYVVALRNIELPSQQCRPTLLTLAGGDRQRMQSLTPVRHLLRCSTCASLSEPLLRRHRGLVAALPFVVAWRALSHAAKSHPAATTTAAATVAAGAAIIATQATGPHLPPGGPLGARTPPPAAVPAPGAGEAGITVVPSGAPGGRALPTSAPPSSAPPSSAAPSSAPPSSAPPSSAPSRPAPSAQAAATPTLAPATVGGSSAALTVDGRPLPAGGSLVGDIGRQVSADGVTVEAVVTHNGFWVGDSVTDRVWVELVGPLRALQVRVGDRVSFTAPLVGQPAAFPVEAGVDGAGGAAQLAAEGAHVSVPTTAITITH